MICVMYLLLQVREPSGEFVASFSLPCSDPARTSSSRYNTDLGALLSQQSVSLYGYSRLRAWGYRCVAEATDGVQTPWTFVVHCLCRS